MKTSTIEQELKLGVPTEAALIQLEARLGGSPNRVLSQQNIFYDHDRRLTRARWSLRLRIQNSVGLLNLKGPKTSGDALLVSRPETPDVEIDDALVERLLASQDDPLRHLAVGLAGHDAAAYTDTARTLLDGAIPTRIGDFKNERRTIVVQRAGLELEIEADRTDYGEHGRFFEVELEIPSRASETQQNEIRRWLEDLFTSLEIPIVGSPSKQQRLLEFIDA